MYRHTEEMGEISGFGGGYESCCQDMLEAGVKWLAERPDANLEGHSFKGIYGIMVPDSDDAKELDKVVIDASGGEASGAMHHAVMSRLFFISKNGWDVYAEKVTEAQKDRD